MSTLAAPSLIPQPDAARRQALRELDAKITRTEAEVFRLLAPVMPALIARAAAAAPVTLLAAHGRPPENLSRRLAKLRMRSRY
jgi:hypothetical protein